MREGFGIILQEQHATAVGILREDREVTGLHWLMIFLTRLHYHISKLVALPLLIAADGNCELIGERSAPLARGDRE